MTGLHWFSNFLGSSLEDHVLNKRLLTPILPATSACRAPLAVSGAAVLRSYRNGRLPKCLLPLLVEAIPLNTRTISARKNDICCKVTDI